MIMRDALKRLTQSTRAPAAIAAAATLAAALSAPCECVAAQAGRKAPLEYKLREAMVTLSRGPCDGNCPVYNVAASGGGEIVYYGERNVETTGEQFDQISREEFVRLLKAVYEIHFMDMRDNYLSGQTIAIREGGTVLVEYLGATAEQRSILTVTVKGFVKRVVFQPRYAPEELVKLADLIDELTRSGRWTGSGR
jgi:hypothetical protein